MFSRILKHVDHAKCIVRQVKHRIGIAGDDRRLGAGVANKLNPRRQAGKILNAPDIAMNENDAMFLQSLDVGFAASAHEIVHGHHFMPPLAQV